MSEYDNRSFSSDLDTYKHPANVQTTTLVISGVVAGAGSGLWSSSVIDITGLDFARANFNNSGHHSTKYKDLVSESFVLFTSSLGPGPEQGIILYTISGDDLQFFVRWNNPTGGAATITTTTLTIRFVGHQTTLS